jgi:uncharacterized protein (TIGR00645 family)
LNPLERLIERIIVTARWLLVVFYIGLAVGLAVYAVSFVWKLVKIVESTLTSTSTEMILAMLGLIDAALIASLVVMVMLSGYETFVSRIDSSNGQLSWLGKLDASALKVKLAASIVAVSSIHLLQVFLNVEHYENSTIMWSVTIHITFLASALLLAVVDRFASHEAKPD